MTAAVGAGGGLVSGGTGTVGAAGAAGCAVFASFMAARSLIFLCHATPRAMAMTAAPIATSAKTVRDI
jgi:hypothetical protein